MLGCSRETIRKVLRQLEIEGVVWRHQGKGTFMGPPASSIERPLDRIIESASAQDLMDARLVYEPALPQPQPNMPHKMILPPCASLLSRRVGHVTGGNMSIWMMPFTRLLHALVEMRC